MFNQNPRLSVIVVLDEKSEDQLMFASTPTLVNPSLLALKFKLLLVDLVAPAVSPIDNATLVTSPRVQERAEAMGNVL